MSNCPKPLLDVLNPLVSPQATHQEKLDAIRALEETVSDDAARKKESIDAFFALDGMGILKPYFRDDDDEVVLVVSRIVSYITNTTAQHCKALIDHGIHEDLGRLLEHPCVDVIEGAARGLGNIALESVASRDTLLRCGISDKVCAAFEMAESNQELRENRAWLISNLCYRKPRPNELYLVSIYKTLRTALSSLVDAGGVAGNTWLSDALWAVSFLSDGGARNVQRCLDFDLPRLVLKLCLQVPAEVAQVSSTEVVQRRVASEQLGEVLSYLPHADLVRLCAVSKDVFIASVCDHKEVYRRLRLNYILATPSLRGAALRIAFNVLGGDGVQVAVALAHGAAEVLEAMAALPDLSASQRTDILWILSNLAVGPDAHVRVVTNSDVFLEVIESFFFSTNFDVRRVSPLTSSIKSDVLASLFTKSERFVDKVFIPAIAKCLFHSACPTKRLLKDMQGAYYVLGIELSSERKAAIERRIELSGLGQRKQQEQLSIVDALWDRGTRARRREASVEDIAGRLRVYWGFLQGCRRGHEERGGGVLVGGTKQEDFGLVEYSTAVFLLYQEVAEAINVLNRKRERE